MEKDGYHHSGGAAISSSKSVKWDICSEVTFLETVVQMCHNVEAFYIIVIQCKRWLEYTVIQMAWYKMKVTIISFDYKWIWLFTKCFLKNITSSNNL